MKTVTLEVQKRELSSSPRELRRQNIIPAVFYGQGEESVAVQMDYQTFRRIYIKTGSSALIDLKVEGADSKKVLVHDLQIHPLSGKIEHVDFLLVNLKEAITAYIPVEIIGESPAVKDHGGVLNTVKTELHVKCLPLELPHEIKVDISGLEELGSSIHISDIAAIEGVEILDGDEDVIVNVAAPRAEEEPETTEGGEGEAGAEGAEGEAGAEAEGGAEGEEEKSEE
ncbi:MAG TPA: 50S ribosomal protein L25 [Candidatus Gracilibacteria bacterium]|nr:50S ribosomal protein L25 [Candidatus Gracilibacteria bacterium]